MNVIGELSTISDLLQPWVLPESEHDSLLDLHSMEPLFPEPGDRLPTDTTPTAVEPPCIVSSPYSLASQKQLFSACLSSAPTSAPRAGPLPQLFDDEEDVGGMRSQLDMMDLSLDGGHHALQQYLHQQASLGDDALMEGPSYGANTAVPTPAARATANTTVTATTPTPLRSSIDLDGEESEITVTSVQASDGSMRRVFVCSVCLKEHKWRSDLLKHMRTHSGNKPCPCRICGRAFSDPSVRCRHERAHSGLKCCTCYLCGRGFTRKWNMERHMIKYHMPYGTDPAMMTAVPAAAELPEWGVPHNLSH
jgi:hypothetical protein